MAISSYILLQKELSKLKSGVFYPSSNIGYRVAMEYEDVDTGFAMEAINPRPDSGSMAYHKWASDTFEYKCRLSWFGGKAPFKLTLVKGPSGSKIGTSENVQEFTRTVDATVPALYNHALPADLFTVSWQPNAGNIGSTVKWVVMVEDSSGDVLYFKWSTTVDPAAFTVIDSVNGLDANAGTAASPKQTWAAAHVIPNKIILAKDGTYPILSTALHNSANTSRQCIGIGNNVVFDMTSQQFGCSGLASDIAFINITFNGDINTTNNRVFNFGSKVERALWWRCKWRNVNVGTVGTDNPACIFLANLGGAAAGTELSDSVSHRNIAVVDSNVDDSVNVQMFVSFATTGVLVENCSGICGTMSSSNGTHFIHFKDQTCSVSCRFNYAEGTMPDSLISFANQSAWHCHRQECCYNTLNATTGLGIGWNVQNTVAGNTNIGQTVGATRQYCYRNTIITSGSPFFIPCYLPGLEPVNVSNNLIISAAAELVAINYSSHNGYTLLGDNTMRAGSYIDGSKRITTTYKSTLLGKVGAELASTLVL